MNKLVSTSLIAVGSFLLGGSLGLYFAGRECKDCNGTQVPCCEINHMYSAQEMAEIVDSMPIDGDLPNMDSHWGEETGEALTNGFTKGIEEYKEKISNYVNTEVAESTKSPNEVVEEMVTNIPYIISVDAFLNEFEEYSKNTLTYYEGDDVLSDDRNEVVHDVEDYIGDEALTSFGEGSDDENVVYIRNHRKHADYEIIREEGSYAIDILGLDEEDDMEYTKARKFFNLDEDREE